MFLDALLKHATEPLHLLPCENFQRLPLHLTAEEEVSPFMSQLHRELLGRLVPMKYCGDYHDDRCQYGKHHNTASYLSCVFPLRRRGAGATRTDRVRRAVTPVCSICSGRGEREVGFNVFFSHFFFKGSFWGLGEKRPAHHRKSGGTKKCSA